MNQDLTVGKTSAVLWRYCLPLFGSMIFQQLYQIADSLVAGKCIGENALAAVGNSYEITLIFLAIAFGCNIGCSITVAQLFGAKKYGEVQTVVGTAMLASGVLCALLMAAGSIWADGLLRLIHTPASVFEDSKCYLDVYIYGLPFVFFYNIATGIFSALGDSKTPFYFLAVSSCANVAVDILFVREFEMGVAGVAWATFLCQGVGCILALFFVFRRIRLLPATGKVRLFSWRYCGKIAKIALPSMLQQSFISVGNIVIQSVINGFGEAVIAGYSAAVKLNNLVVTSFTTLGNGISTYTAQNYGACKLERIREGYRAGLRMIWAVCAPLAVLYFFAGRFLIHFFMDHPTDVAMETGIRFLRILAPFYFAVSAKLIADGVLRGMGNMKLFMITTFTDLILRVVLAILFSGTALKETGIWLAWPAGWTVATILSTFFCLRKMFQITQSGKKNEGEMPN